MKMENNLLRGWALGLKGVHEDIINKNLGSFIQDKPNGYKPVPGEYVKHCKDSIKSEKASEYLEEIARESNTNLLEDKANDKKSLGYIQSKLLAAKLKNEQITIAEPEEQKDYPHLNISENCDKTGNAVFYACPGHVDSDHFRAQVKKHFDASPMQIKYVYRRMKACPIKNDKGQTVRIANRFLKCGPAEEGAAEITEGY